MTPSFQGPLFSAVRALEHQCQTAFLFSQRWRVVGKLGLPQFLLVSHIILVEGNRPVFRGTGLFWESMQTSFTHFLRVLDASIWITAGHLGKGKLGVCILMVTLQTDSLCLLKPHTKGRDSHNTSLKHAPRCHIQPLGGELRQRPAFLYFKVIFMLFRRRPSVWEWGKNLHLG